MIFFFKFRNYRNSWVFFSVSLDSTFLTFLAMGRISRGSQGADASCWCYLVSALPSVWGRGSSQFGQTISGARWRALGSQAPSPGEGPLWPWTVRPEEKGWALGRPWTVRPEEKGWAFGTAQAPAVGAS